MALCAMLVGGNVLLRRRRQPGALLWMKRSLTIALGLPHVKRRIVTGNKLLQMNRPALPSPHENGHLIISGSNKRAWKMGQAARQGQTHVDILASTSSERLLATQRAFCLNGPVKDEEKGDREGREGLVAVD
ncbi:hypothetical protein EYF80_012819 [Liparis tanakae]|uniref:Uncharacterized protein n=1 Tax=Liparis tanakae TaxID=230148 RepID=A0A4Z2IIE9_9TELE|nr:hypothetical protein EYF80_012819 [Liparis tanakae]